jgi:uncharacterized protein
MIIAVTGSTGLVGNAIVEALEADGQLVRCVVRRAPADKNEIRWDPAAGTIDAAEFANVDAVVHLAGENIAGKRWSESFKKELLDSRVRSTKLLCETLAALATKPSVLVSASAIGYYGSRGEQPVDESSPAGNGFLAEVCRQWEDATKPARDANIRVVNLRIGFVLAREGGGLQKMLTPFKLGAGGPIAGGKQYMPWIHVDDVVGMYLRAIDDPAWSGAVNATAPEPVTNRTFSKALGRALHRPAVAPIPGAAIRLLYGDMAEIVTKGQRVIPKRAIELGYTYQHADLDEALEAAVG